jgi:tetrahydromethanopterin S-methyltransferase subunit G
MDNSVVNFILTLLASGGLLTILGLLIKAYFEKEVKKAVTIELKEINKDIDNIKTELGKKQSKEICLISHNNIDRRLESIENKLDRLIEIRDN